MQPYRAIKLTFTAVIIALVGLTAWEVYAVWRAEQRTPAILAVWRAKPQPLALSSLSSEQKDILLRVEDPGFYSHQGVDFVFPGQGMTTVTQALVKFLYFDAYRPGFEKIEQSLIARFVLDRHLGKDEQLGLFINHVYLGRHGSEQIRGFAAGAKAHFGKPFQELSRDEFIGLVAMLIGPNRIRPDKPAAFKERVARIKTMLAGRCAPTGVLDATYEACASLP